MEQPTLNAEDLSNIMTMRYKLLSQMLGQQEQRDIDKECGYPKTITAADCKFLYEREGIATRAVGVFPAESWKQDPEVYEKEDDTETQFEKDWKALVKKFNLFGFLQRADRLSGIGTFGVILLGISDGKTLELPVEGIDDTGTARAGLKYQLLYIRTFDETEVTISSYETDVTNPRYGMPKMYSINYAQIAASTSQPAPPANTVAVHWSRIIHLADNLESSEVMGVPRLKTIWNRLYDLRKVLSSSGEMFWKGGFPGFSFETNPNLTLTGEIDRDSLRAEFEKYQNGLQRYLALTGMTAKSLAPQVSDPTAHFTTHLKAICVSLGIPYRIFMGSEEAQLAGEQDATAWNERLKERQCKYITPRIITPLANRLMDLGCVAPIANRDEGICVEWPDLHTPSDKEKADVAKTKTESMVSYVSGGADALMPPEIFFEWVLGYSKEEVKAIMDAAKKYVDEEGGLHDELHGQEQLEKQSKEQSIEQSAELHEERHDEPPQPKGGMPVKR